MYTEVCASKMHGLRCARVYIIVCECTSARTQIICMSRDVCLYVYIQTGAYTYTRVCVHMYTHTDVCIHSAIYVCTHLIVYTPDVLSNTSLRHSA